ncbi:2818_t:CDS:1, partial [Scutellospora calospora]
TLSIIPTQLYIHGHLLQRCNKPQSLSELHCAHILALLHVYPLRHCVESHTHLPFTHLFGEMQLGIHERTGAGGDDEGGEDGELGKVQSSFPHCAQEPRTP